MEKIIQGKWKQTTDRQSNEPGKVPDAEIYKTYSIQNEDDRLFYINDKLHGVWSVDGDILVEVDYAGNCTKYLILELTNSILKLSDFTTMTGMDLVEEYSKNENGNI